MLIYKTLDLPEPPQWLLNNAMKLLPDVSSEKETILRKHDNNITKVKMEIANQPHNNIFREVNIENKTYKHAQINFIDLGNESLKWAKNNLEKNINMFEISYTTLNRQVSGAHTDTTEGYVLIYPVETGGAAVKTVFYKEKNCELIREGRLWYNSYEDLEVIGELILPKNKWSIFNTRVIHGVEGMEKSRVLLQARFGNTITNSKIQ